MGHCSDSCKVLATAEKQLERADVLLDAADKLAERMADLLVALSGSHVAVVDRQFATAALEAYQNEKNEGVDERAWPTEAEIDAAMPEQEVPLAQAAG